MNNAPAPTAPPTIWEALAAWAKGLKKWQQTTLELAVTHGRLSEEQIIAVYEQLCSANALGPKSEVSNDPIKIAAPTADGADAIVQLN